MRTPVGLLGDLLAQLAAFAIHVLETTGYAGLFVLMVAESMILPVPSEAVMPFAGYLAAQGKMTILGALLASSAGSIVGSWIGYEMGTKGLAPLVRKWGKYVLLQPHHLDAAERFFVARGALAVFVCRFIPGVRHVVSIPAGSAKMPMTTFVAASATGATIWNMFLFSIGYKYGEAAAATIKPYLDIAAIALSVLLAVYFVYEWRKSRLKEPVRLKG